MLVWKGLGDVHRWINGRLLKDVLKRLQNLAAVKVRRQASKLLFLDAMPDLTKQSNQKTNKGSELKDPVSNLENLLAEQRRG